MPRNVEFSTRIYIAEENFSHGLALCLTVVACPYNTGDIWQISELLHFHHAHSLHDNNSVGIDCGYSLN